MLTKINGKHWLFVEPFVLCLLRLASTSIFLLVIYFSHGDNYQIVDMLLGLLCEFEEAFKVSELHLPATQQKNLHHSADALLQKSQLL